LYLFASIKALTMSTTTSAVSVKKTCHPLGLLVNFDSSHSIAAMRCCYDYGELAFDFFSSLTIYNAPNMTIGDVLIPTSPIVRLFVIILLLWLSVMLEYI